MVPPVLFLTLAQALVETVLTVVVLAVLHSAVVLQMAIPAMYLEEEVEEHEQSGLTAPKLVALVLPGKL